MSEEKVEWNSEGVQAHLTISQSVIQRMAANSASCKAWCVALISAILFTVGNAQILKPELALIALVPLFLFFVLDAYYLSLEKSFRESYNSFIKKLHARKIEADDLFVIEPKGDKVKLFWTSIQSLSVWPFYMFMLIIIGMAFCLISSLQTTF